MSESMSQIKVATTLDPQAELFLIGPSLLFCQSFPLQTCRSGDTTQGTLGTVAL